MFASSGKLLLPGNNSMQDGRSGLYSAVNSITVYGNIFVNKYTAFSGIFRASHVKVYNNVFADVSGLINSNVNQSGSISIKNNIFYNIAGKVISGTVALNHGYNCYYVIDYSLSSDLYETTSVYRNPAFKTGSYQLESYSPCIGIGTEINMIKTDRLGRATSFGTGRDLGAYKTY